MKYSLCTVAKSSGSKLPHCVLMSNDNVAIYCPVMFDVTWLFDGQNNLPHNVRVERDGLFLDNVNGENTGIYSCQYTTKPYIIKEVDALVEVVCKLQYKY